MLDSQSQSSYDGRWIRAMMLISLDRAIPFYPLMGLRTQNPVDLKNFLRNYIKEHPDKFYFDLRKRGVLVINDVVLFLKSHLDSATADEFQYWMTYLYCEGSREHLELQNWTLVLRAARCSEEQWAELFSKQLRNEVLLRFNNMTCLKQYNSLCQQVFNQSFSDWDRKLYGMNLWNDDLPDCPNGPKSQIYPIFAAAQGYSFWSWLLPQLSNSELESLHAAGQRLVETTDSLQYIHNIASPAFLIDLPIRKFSSIT